MGSLSICSCDDYSPLVLRFGTPHTNPDSFKSMNSLMSAIKHRSLRMNATMNYSQDCLVLNDDMAAMVSQSFKQGSQDRIATMLSHAYRASHDGKAVKIGLRTRDHSVKA